jgi:hypothetical protein
VSLVGKGADVERRSSIGNPPNRPGTRVIYAAIDVGRTLVTDLVPKELHVPVQSPFISNCIALELKGANSALLYPPGVTSGTGTPPTPPKGALPNLNILTGPPEREYR